jgi:hypothetical protein
MSTAVSRVSTSGSASSVLTLLTMFRQPEPTMPVARHLSRCYAAAGAGMIPSWTIIDIVS